LTARQRAHKTLALLISLGVAIGAQRQVATHKYVWDGVVLYLISLSLFIWTLLGDSSVARPLAVRREAVQRRHATAAAWASAFLGLMAFLALGGNTFTRLNVGLWLGSIACFLYAFWEGSWSGLWEKARKRLTPGGFTLRLSWTAGLLILIVLVGAFFQFHRLGSIPAEMTSDHAEKLLDVKDVLEGKRSVFFPRNTGREPWQFYMTALIIRLTGMPLSYLALKLGTALIGTLTVPATYLLAREVAEDRRAGLVAALMVALSHWHIAISRVGLRFPLNPLPVAITLFFLLRGLKHNRRNDFILAGLAMGVGLHGYSPFRVMVPFVLAVLVLDALCDRRPRPGGWGQLWTNAALMFAATTLVFLPLLRYMLDNPRMFWYRTLTRTGSLERPLARDLLDVFLENQKNGLLMFHWKGDIVWVNTIPHEPALDVIGGALLVLGVAYALFRLIRHRELVYLHLLLGIWFLLLPSTLSLAFPNENPSVVRAGGAIPLVFTLATLPVTLAIRRLEEVFGRAGVVLAFLLVSLMACQMGRDVYQWYFIRYDEQHRRSSWNASEIARAMRGFADSVGDLEHAYLKSFPHWVDHRNVGIWLVNDPTWDNRVMDIEEAVGHVSDPAPKLYILHPADQASLARLQELFPQGTVRRYPSRTPGKEFLGFFVPGKR